ncbi:hypothetical protein [Desertivirga xinjiangensis]|uniref:hypothetical protein n=1 Tax=Desertivirga xinjiangensis TaxID=539206 RepID=UPI00210CA7C8|nr:hypothetical protein [Pedobacter xinjiangensis]
MNQTQWTAIRDFDLDRPLRSYGFSTRLAMENNWTINFASEAILEYKKFMYLAAISDSMVSPSEIVDVVWHQHLVDTKSYHQFCQVLGKRIEHIPSTHHPAEYDRFRHAKETTQKLYGEIFGDQPPTFWNYSNIYEPLALGKARYKIRAFLLLAIPLVLLAYIPLFYLLRNSYVQIGNPGFLIGYVLLFTLILLFLEFYNRKKFAELLNRTSSDAFIFKLDPLELVYLQTGKIENVLHGQVSLMIDKQKLDFSENILKNQADAAIETVVEYSISEVIDTYGPNRYPPLLKHLIARPVFRAMENSLDAVKKYFVKSHFFSRIFYLNFFLLAMTLLAGFVRLGTGISMDKPVGFLVIILFILLVVSVAFLNRTTNLIARHSIPAFFKQNFKDTPDDWSWRYFLEGNAVLNSLLLPVIIVMTKTNGPFSDSTGSSCSSGGSDCGGASSGCGGCGGD